MFLKKALLTVACLLIASPVFAQTIAPGDLPAINLAANNQRGGVTGVLPAANGGSGSSTVLTNGQLLIGHTGNAPSAANLTAGTGVAVTNGAGSITVGLTTPVSVANGGTGTALFTSGSATFVSAGSIAVADASITASSIVVVTQTGSTPVSEYFSVAVNAGTGFTIYSSNSSSTAVVHYIRVK
jgi:hypothetical protein